MYIRVKNKKYSGVIKLLWSPDWGELPFRGRRHRWNRLGQVNINRLLLSLIDL